MHYRAPELFLGCSEYSTPVDIWSVGCIFAEMSSNNVLFEGDSEIDQIFRIFRFFFFNLKNYVSQKIVKLIFFRVLGTPTDKTWPGVSKMKLYKSTFPQFVAQDLENFVNSKFLGPDGMDLLKRLLKLNPVERISAHSALNHVFFFIL